jgi:hypothetical protein
MKVTPLKNLSWYKVSDPRFHGASGAIISKFPDSHAGAIDHTVSKVRRREVSNGMMFKQFMGVPLLDYFTEISSCHCTWNELILTQLVLTALRFCLCSLGHTASASLFHQSSFCHTPGECSRHNEPSAACFFSQDAFCFAVGPNLVTVTDVRVLIFSGWCSWGFRSAGIWGCVLWDTDVARQSTVRFFKGRNASHCSWHFNTWRREYHVAL